MEERKREPSDGVWARWKERVQALKLETWAVYLACRDPRTPWTARLVALCVVGYALSPIDLVPDFIPVLGYLDDLILVPLGLALALRMIPRPILDECRERARQELSQGKLGWGLSGLRQLARTVPVADQRVVGGCRRSLIGSSQAGRGDEAGTAGQ